MLKELSLVLVLALGLSLVVLLGLMSAGAMSAEISSVQLEVQL